MVGRALGFVGSFVVIAVCAGSGVGQEDGLRRLRSEDVGRVAELHRVTRVLGDDLFPGFDTSLLPVAVNVDDREEVLIGHPHPPEGFTLREDFADLGVPVYVLEGRTRYGPRGGGWSVPLGGEPTAYVSVCEVDQTTEDWISLVLHECFHVFQNRLPQMALGQQLDLPGLDADYASGLALESRTLHAALRDDDPAQREGHLRQFLAVRHERRQGLAAELLAAEDFEEFLEGTPTYAQARMFELLAESGSLEGAAELPAYHAFEHAAEEYEKLIQQVLPPAGTRVDFHHAQYRHGMAQCLLLDRVQPDWKEHFGDEAVALTTLLERRFPQTDAERSEALASAREEFLFQRLHAEQKALVDELRATLESYLHAEGLRLRVRHGEISGRFQWKPLGPVYNLPADMTPEHFTEPGRPNLPGRGLTIWAGGMETFEREGLRFTTTSGSVIFGQSLFEWVDRDTRHAADEVAITSAREEDGVHVDLKLDGPGFHLELPRGRVERDGEVVWVVPVREPAR